MGGGGVLTPTNSPSIDNKISKKKIMLSKNKKAASVKYNTNTLTFKHKRICDQNHFFECPVLLVTCYNQTNCTVDSGP